MNTRKILFTTAAATTGLLAVTPAHAQDYYVGQITIMSSNFCPRGTTDARGQILPISSNTALFSLFGTMYGGDGRTTFALPDLRSRIPRGWGQGPGLSAVAMGQQSGTDEVTLLTSQMPAHTHSAMMMASSSGGTGKSPASSGYATLPAALVYNNDTTPSKNMWTGSAATTPTGGSIPFEIQNPYETLRYCVVTQGIFPPRN